MSRKKKSSRSGVARGRMYLKARLGWLSGFPLQQSPGRVIWLALPRFGDRLPQEMAVTGRDLHRASRTWQKLTTRFPRALPQIVENLDHWQNGVPLLISLLSDAIHQGKALPRSLFEVSGFYPSELCRNGQALAAEQPTLRPWLAALSWFSYLYPPEVTAALTWSRRHARELDTMIAYNGGLAGIVLTQQLWSLTFRDGADLLAPIRRLLGNTEIYTTPVTNLRDVRSYSEHWTQLLKTARQSPELPKYPARPEAKLGSILVRFLAALVGHRRQVRRNALSLFNLVWSDKPLLAWAAWWAESERRVWQAKQLFHLKNRLVIDTESKKLRRDFHSRREQLPPPIFLDHILTQIQIAAQDSTFYHELNQILPISPKVGKGSMMRAALLNYWVSLLPFYRRQLPILLRCLRTSWQRVGNQPGMFAPWMSLFAAWHKGTRGYPWYVEATILQEVPEQRLWPIICDTLVACAGVRLQLDVDISQDDDAEESEIIDAEALVKLATMTEDATQAKLLFDSLTAQPLKSSYLAPELLSCAYHLDDSHRYFGRLVAKLQTILPEEVWIIPALRLAAEKMEAGGWQGMAAVLILHGHMKRLAQIGQRLLLLAQFGQVVPPPLPLPPDAKTPAWIQSYPQRFYPALRLLASLHPAAQKRAAGVLKKNFPDNSRLQQEIAVLRQKISEDSAQPKLAKRLTHLEQRLTTPQPVSEQRLARLEEKLVQLVAQQALTVWEVEIDAALRQRWQRKS